MSVGEEEHLLVAQCVRHLVDGGVGEAFLTGSVAFIWQLFGSLIRSFGAEQQLAVREHIGELPSQQPPDWKNTRDRAPLSGA